ncbi:hypothetical protein [Siminovitchia sp. 179-K 8D1 HS]|uniref:hypothetical protein n=1 Tax=Siminovitchia sp. 179-K 8D1 HS TaxID=3142385 RepID=UPI00399F606F
MIHLSNSNNGTKTSNLTKAQQEANKYIQEYTEQLQRNFAAIQRMEVAPTESKRNSAISKFDANQVAAWLQNPSRYEKQLRQLSNYFYNVSSHYKRIIWYLALLPTYAYVLEPMEMPNKLNKEKYLKAYLKNLQEIEKMNLSHELINVSKIAYKEDTFYGYIYESKDSFFFHKLNPDYCKISSIEDGVFNFAFDFSYFDRNNELESYPDEFKRKYNTYKSTKEKWIEIDSDKSACFKVNEEILEYDLPPFNTMFESIFDLDEYKKIKKAKAKIDNFLLLTQKIPMDEKNPDLNKFLIDLDLAMKFHGMISDSLPDGVGLATSPMEITATRMEKSKSDTDTIAQAQREVYTDAGVSQFIFNSDKNTSIGLSKSIIADEQIAFSFLRQVERWINRRLKKMPGQYKFQLKFLDQTVFNRTEMTDLYLKAAQASMPVINELGASLGMSPLDLYNKAQLENEVLGLHDMLKPLASSHTQSKGDVDKGRPVKDDDEVADSTQVTRDRDADNRKVDG